MPTRSGKRIGDAALPEKVVQAAAEAVEAQPGTGTLSAYELQRLENIRRNEEVLASLNLTSARKELGMTAKGPSARPSQRGVGTARKRSASPALPTRTSARTKQIAPDYTGIRMEHADGRVELASGDVVLPGSGKVLKAEDAPQLDPWTPRPFHRTNDEDNDDNDADADAAGAFAEQKVSGDGGGGEEDEEDEEDEAPLTTRLPAARAAAASLPKPDARDCALLHLVGAVEQTASPPPSEAQRLASATLSDAMVAKVTRSAVVHLHFQPRGDTMLLACGDKEGHVSLWHAGRAAADPSDGVHLHKPHRQYVSGMAWSDRRDHSLFSAS